MFGRSIRKWTGCAFLGSIVFVACEEGGFSAKYAPEFQRGPTTISVFGVFKDGRLNAEAWGEIGPRLSASLGAHSCDIAYGEPLLGGSPALAAAVDDYTRANGVTEGVLELFAPAAKSDALLLVTISGRPPHTTADAGPAPSQSPQTSRRGGGGRYGRGMNSPTTPDRRDYGERGTFDISAVLYSVKSHHPVATFDMQYSGPSADDAYAKFATRFGAELAGSRCGGWSFETPIDPKAIESLKED